MRLSAIAVAVAAAGVVDVAAAPMRVIMVSSNVQGPPAHIRWGLAAAPIAPVSDNTHAVHRMSHGKPCSGRLSRFRQKSIEISNAFRQALGWPLIESHSVANPGHGFSILPVNPGEVQFLPPLEPGNKELWMAKAHGRPVALHHFHGAHHRFHRGGDKPFFTRLHHSLMNLGVWEGRAVAFVLGCGIGVLLRMFWILAIVAYRMVKRGSTDEEEEDEYTHIVMFEDTSMLPPYPVDEKVPFEAEVKPAEAAPEAK